MARAESVREKLWQTRQKLVRLQAEQDRFDYRLRYKLRLENLSATTRKMGRLEVKNYSLGTLDPAPGFDFTDFELPGHSRFEIAVYSLQKHGDTVSEATVTMKDLNHHVSFALLGGLGLSHWVLRSVLLKSQDGQQDSGKTRWMVADCTKPAANAAPVAPPIVQPAEPQLAVPRL